MIQIDKEAIKKLTNGDLVYAKLYLSGTKVLEGHINIFVNSVYIFPQLIVGTPKYKSNTLNLRSNGLINWTEHHMNHVDYEGECVTSIYKMILFRSDSV